LVSVFADLDAVASSGGELGAEIEYGPRVGPETLREALCNGAVRLIGIEHGRPVVTSDAAHTIPGAIRAFVARRDSRCTIDGCRSRYRLQPHHIRHRVHGGTHDPANLTTLCWYHHHVAGTHTLRWLPSCWPDLEGTNARARVSTATATASTPTAHH
jgi:hypothetical protein